MGKNHSSAAGNQNRKALRNIGNAGEIHRLGLKSHKAHRRNLIEVGGVGAGVKGKSQKPPADNQNRKALGDIGNTVNAARVVMESKPLPQCSRPMTRAYDAQLRRAQLTDKQQPSSVFHVDGSSVRTRQAEAAAEEGRNGKKAIVVAMPGDGDANAGSSCATKRSLKRMLTQSSALRGRSKGVCLCSERMPEVFVHDQLAMPEYVEDLYSFYRNAEEVCRPSKDYMKLQPEINPKMRSILVDWLVGVHRKYELVPETLYLTVDLIDRYLSLKRVYRKEFQLVGIGAMLIACKYEEIWVPEVRDFICVTDGAFQRTPILMTEKHILEALDWKVTVPTAYVFLLRFLRINTLPAPAVNELTEHLVFFLSELGLMNYSILAHPASSRAAAAVYIARTTISIPPRWNQTLKWHACLRPSVLGQCARILASTHSEVTATELRAVFRKYSSSRYGAVAMKYPRPTSISPASTTTTTRRRRTTEYFSKL